MSIIRTTVNVKVTQKGLGIKDGFEISMYWGDVTEVTNMLV